MGLIDDFFGLLDKVFRGLLDITRVFSGLQNDGAASLEPNVQPSEQIGSAVDRIQPVDEFTGFVVDTVEEAIVSAIDEEGQLTPDNVEEPLDDAEGAATAFLGGVVGLSGAIEGGSFGFVDEFPSEIVDAVSALGIADVTGREIDARLQEGVDPALKQLVHKDHRSKQADFQDFVEGNLREKRLGDGVSTREGVGEEPLDGLLHPDDLGWLDDPDTYGTVPGQTSLFELAGLKVNEPEEIIEEPIQYGIPVPLRPVEQITELSGQPEDVKGIYRQVIDQLPKSENLIQDYARLTEFNFQLREAVREGRATPKVARRVIEPELEDLIVNALPDDRYREKDREADEVVSILAGELQRNFELIDSIPEDPPSLGDIQAWFEKGVIDSREFESLYLQFGNQDEFLGRYLRESAIDQGTEAIQRQFLLDRISASEARLRLGIIGWSNQEAAQILSGTPPESLLQNRQENVSQTAGVPLGALPEIGDQRASLLRSIGITSIEDVANASIEDLTQATTLTDQEAQTAINAAQRVLEAQAS